MCRVLVALCLLALAAVISAVPVAVINRYVPIAVDPNGVPLHRFKRQFMPFGSSYGNSFGVSESMSFNMYDTGYSNNWFG
ncbi:hypothetical protein ANCCAN_06494 [Ancylostoma caninum]|uniref:Uncharacterized protein n=1 Tax=Ancylostoma caninum TaxID=29170 RepID=A0A368GSW8_ANCCA|nr:hypothetical protein ANCCAN_06494 [Ancylostoma caninum]